MILDAEKIRALRVEWLDDFVDLRPEWGQAVAASASAGASSLSLTGAAASGTLRSGTAFELAHNGSLWRYILTADATLSSGAATVAIAPPLAAAIPSAVDAELEALGMALYGARIPASGYEHEGFAEYVARTLLGESGAAIAP